MQIYFSPALTFLLSMFLMKTVMTACRDHPFGRIDSGLSSIVKLYHLPIQLSRPSNTLSGSCRGLALKWITQPNLDFEKYFTEHDQCIALQCCHKMSFSKRNSGITWLASLISLASSGGPVNHQIFNIWRLVCTKLCLRIDVTCTNVIKYFGFSPVCKTWWTLRLAFLKSQCSSLFTPFKPMLYWICWAIFLVTYWICLAIFFTAYLYSTFCH